MTSIPEAPTIFDGLPRLEFGVWPTPLHRMDKASDELGIDLWIKRDDLTGLALGGNKVRKLEFLLADALKANADVIITTGGSQSNHARLAAAACAKLGLECHLVLDRGRHPNGGNLLLDDLFGAIVHLLDDSDPAVAVAQMDRLRAEMEEQGRRPYVIPRGGSIPQGAVGYAAMVPELISQLDAAQVTPDVVVVATGSCGTHSGIMAGHAIWRPAWRVQGVSVSRPKSLQEPRVLELANQVLSWLDSDDRAIAGDIAVDDGYTGAAYGVPTDETWEAITFLAQLEAIVLDPVYTGKTFAGLLGQVRQGAIPRNSTVVFIHTGGSPALFAYADEAPFTSEQ